MVFTELLRKYFQLPNCRECEVLRQQLGIANDEKRKLLNALLEVNKPIISTPEETRDELPKPVGQARVPWHITQARLEAEDRVRAEAIKREREEAALQAKLRSTDEIEKELLDASSDDRKESSDVNAVA